MDPWRQSVTAGTSAACRDAIAYKSVGLRRDAYEVPNPPRRTSVAPLTDFLRTPATLGLPPTIDRSAKGGVAGHIQREHAGRFDLAFAGEHDERGGEEQVEDQLVEERRLKRCIGEICHW